MLPNADLPTDQPTDQPTDRIDNPAKFSSGVLRVFADLLAKYEVKGVVLDPFAGTGRVFELESNPNLTIDAIEIEPEWAAHHPGVRVGNALDMPGVRPGSVAAIVTSPTYGNRMADHHEAKDGSRRHTYRHYLGRMPSEGSSAVMHWGPKYRTFHRAAYRAMYDALEPGGLALINISNFIRRGKEMPVSGWTRGVWIGLGAEWLETVDIDTPRLRHGANYKARVGAEQVHVLRKQLPRHYQLPLPFDGWTG